MCVLLGHTQTVPCWLLQGTEAITRSKNYTPLQKVVMDMLKGNHGEDRCEVFQTAVFNKSPQMTTFLHVYGYACMSWILGNILLCCKGERNSTIVCQRGWHYGKEILNSLDGIMATTY